MIFSGLGNVKYTEVDWDNIHYLLQQILMRIPALKSCTVEKIYNYPEVYSPDLKWIIGESTEVFLFKIFHYTS